MALPRLQHTFSVTSGTIFAFHKQPLKDYLIAIAIFTNAVKCISALQLARDLDVQYKTAFVLAHKIRESLMEHRDESALTGEIHVDGAYVNGHRPSITHIAKAWIASWKSELSP